MNTRTQEGMDAFAKYQEETHDFIFDSIYKPLRETLNERKYRAGDTRVSARVLAHWNKTGLIPEGVKDGSDGWRKFSGVEMVWLRVIVHLRDFGLSLERILRVKQEIIHWNEKTKCYPYFEFCIAETLSGAEIYIHVSANGSARLLYLGDYSHGLFISLRSILKELHLDLAEGRNWFNLSDNEMRMLTEVGNEETDAMQIARAENAEEDLNEIGHPEECSCNKCHHHYGKI